MANRSNIQVYLLTLFSLAASGCDMIQDIAPGHGYSAKNICSNLFISTLDLEEVKSDFVGPEIDPLSLLWKIQVDEGMQTVTASDVLFGNRFKAEAVYRPGLGCTLQHDLSRQALYDQLTAPLQSLSLPDDLAWPYGNKGVTRDEVVNSQENVDYAQVDQAIDDAFYQNDVKQTTSVVVAYQGQLIAERYREGFNEATPVLGWSMSKSVTSSLVGIVVEQTGLDVNASAPIAEWQGTEKSVITTANLLHMAHGLQYKEVSRGPDADQAKMLYLEPNTSQYMIERPLIETPGTKFEYSSGATAVLARIVQNAVGGSLNDAHEFYQAGFFHRIDIATAVIEHDTAGIFMGGVSVFMSPRDWARLGQLYLQEGVWQDEVILTRDWLDFALTPSPAKDTFGAHLWLNTDQKRWPSLPVDAFGFMGHNEQAVFIIPSKQLVVVRTGFTFGGEAVAQKEALVAAIIAALPDTSL